MFPTWENSLNSIKSLLRVAIAFGVLLVFSGCQSAQVMPTITPLSPTSKPPTATPNLPTLTPTPAVILASDQPIKIQNYSIVITYKGYKNIGFNPSGGSNTMAHQFSVSEETGKIDEVVALNILITDSKGKWIEGAFQESGTNQKGLMLLFYNILTTEPGGKYFMKFPTGEMIYLTPLIK
jgi:hypothetical protein